MIKNRLQRYHSDEEYRKKHLAYCNAYYLKNKEYVLKRIKEKKNVYESNAWWQEKFNKLKQRAKKRNKIFNLSLENYKLLRSDWKCAYCGTNKNFSVDRINNTIGYIEENVIASCRSCNSSKSNIFTYKETLLLKEINGYLKGLNLRCIFKRI